MRKRTQVVTIVGSVVMAVLITGGVTCHYGILKPFIDLAEGPNARQRRLLCETDFQAMLNACRELSRRVASGELEEGPYGLPKMSHFPEPIPTLRPSFVTLGRDGAVRVEMGFGGLASYSFGVYAYPESYTTPHPGDRKLIEGLWYYDEGYRGDSNSYDRRIDQLLAKSGRLKQP